MCSTISLPASPEKKVLKRKPSTKGRSKHTRKWSTKKKQLLRRIQRLIDFLGGCCCRCGTKQLETDEDGTNWHTQFQFHHPNGRDWIARKVSWVARISRYWRDAEAGNLELVCWRCHNQITSGLSPKRNPAPKPSIERPF